MLGAKDPLHLRQSVAKNSLGLAVLALVPECDTQVHRVHERIFVVSTTEMLVHC